MPLTQVSPGLLDSNAQYYGFKNRIINGAMVIDQRNNGASVTSTGDTYSLDRWMAQSGGAATSKYSVQRVSDAPAGFVNSLKVTSLSAYSVLTNDYADINQRVEGFNIADLAWGTASAQAVTLSFWVKSSLTGTFGGSIRGSSFSRSYPFSYTVSSANTWEYKTVTIPGDTSGSWATDNGVGLQLAFGLGNGSAYTGTAGSWASSFAIQPTSTVSVIGTNGATFYITGVQLEKGSTATSFDYRPYGTELALCQRYYWQINSETSYAGLGSGVMVSGSQARIFMPYPVPMRAAPTVSGTSLSSLRISQGADITPTNLTPYANSRTCMFDMATSGGNTNAGAVLIFNNLSTGSIQATAEL